MKWNWDYDLPENWEPQTDAEWAWYLTRKLNYGDYKKLKVKTIKKYFPDIKHKLDPGKRAMLKHFLHNAANT